MNTTPEPASTEPTPRSAAATETLDAAKPPAEATETETAESPEPSQVDEARTSRDEGDVDSPSAGTDRSESDEDSDLASQPASDAQSDGESDEDSDLASQPASDAESDSREEDDSDEERQLAAEEFAAEHDPANHDIAAGEEFRQPGDWTAEDGGPQVWDSEGNLISEDDGKVSDADVQGQPDGDPTGDGGRRVSELEEVRDGGYSVGSAATIHDGAMPLGHPVKAWEDTKTFVTEGHDHYEEAEPHVWFADAEAAERAGFQPAD